MPDEMLRRVAPTAITESTNLVGTVEDVQDEAAGSPGPDERWLTTVVPGQPTQVKLSLSPPPYCDQLVGTQTLRLWLRKRPGSSDIKCGFALYEAYDDPEEGRTDYLVHLFDNVSITSETGELVELEFYASELLNLTATAEIRLEIVTTLGLE